MSNILYICTFSVYVFVCKGALLAGLRKSTFKCAINSLSLLEFEVFAGTYGCMCMYKCMLRGLQGASWC